MNVPFSQWNDLSGVLENFWNMQVIINYLHHLILRGWIRMIPWEQEIEPLGMQNSLHHTQCFCFCPYSVLCSTGISPQDVVCSPFPNQKFSCSKYKKTCHDIFHVQNSPTSVNFSFSKPIAKKHPCSKGSLGYPIQPIHGHSHCSSNRSTCWEENFSEGLLHCVMLPSC